MKTKLPKDMDMVELYDLIFLVIKANYPDIKDEGIELLLEYFGAGLDAISVDSEYWEDVE